MSLIGPEQILKQWQSWGQELSQQPTLVSPLGNGLTNKSYLLDSTLGKLVLRINNPNSASLGINREREALILEELDKLNIGPKIIYKDHQHGSLDQGYLVYRFIKGNVWTKADICKQQNQQRLRELIAQYQKIQLPLEPRNYKNYLLDYWQQLEERGLISEELQRQWSEFLPSLDQSNWSPCLSHHDLTPDNIIETADGHLQIIDWEYAHLGHPGLDWASISGEHLSPASDLLCWMNRLWKLLAD